MSSYKKDYYENAYIYVWKNKLDGKCYIGQTVNEKQRYNKHVNAVHSLKKTNNKFHNALKKYGLENFEQKTRVKFEMLELGLTLLVIIFCLIYTV